MHSVPAAARAPAESDFYGPPRYSHRVHGRHTRVCWCGLSCSRTGCSPAPSAVVGGAIAGVAVDLRRCRRPEGKAGESQVHENGRVRPSTACAGRHLWLAASRPQQGHQTLTKRGWLQTKHASLQCRTIEWRAEVVRRSETCEPRGVGAEPLCRYKHAESVKGKGGVKATQVSAEHSLGPWAWPCRPPRGCGCARARSPPGPRP